uniref:poly(ADP-ribose) glycohydrolase n=1 Tax=Angiostrongylus cantonensis TaxID=6313 RepID=A0A158PBZ6_ANGCA
MVKTWGIGQADLGTLGNNNGLTSKSLKNGDYVEDELFKWQVSVVPGMLNLPMCFSSIPFRNKRYSRFCFLSQLNSNATQFICTVQPVPLLRANHYGSVTLSQEQCACLLAHAFFCTYRRERRNFNRINIIFDDQNPMCCVKLRFILHYFSIVLKKMPTGCVSFRREALPPDDTSIEDSYGCLQVDFANEYIGGGVLTWGAVQEEIRFLICPEMIVSCLLCEKMGPLEVVHIVGAQRYSSYVGYGNNNNNIPPKYLHLLANHVCNARPSVVQTGLKVAKRNF